MGDGQFGPRATSDHFERFEITLEATKPRKHGAAGTFGRVARPMRQMRRDAHLPTLTRLGVHCVPKRFSSGENVLPSMRVDQRCGREAMFGKYRIPFP